MALTARAGPFDPRRVQALLLRGYGNLTCSRYHLRTITEPVDFANWVRRLLDEGHIKHLHFPSGPPRRWTPSSNGPQPPPSWWGRNGGTRRHVDSAPERWNVNIAFTSSGLEQLGYDYRPVPGLERDAFTDGLAARQGAGWRAPADPPSRDGVHVLIWTTAVDAGSLDDSERVLFGDPAPTGTAPIDEPGFPLDAQRLGEDDGIAATYSHFGFLDGTSTPHLEELTPDARSSKRLAGGGVPDARRPHLWRPVKIGEFLLGHPHEGLERVADQEWVYDGPQIHSLSGISRHQNGSFVVFRKLQQHVDTYARWLDKHTSAYAAHLQRQSDYLGIAVDDHRARLELAGSLVGRYPGRVPHIDGDVITWSYNANDDSLRPGTPLTGVRPGTQNDFNYREDALGHGCPLGAHIRRANPRDTMGSPELTARHRIIRQGFPYGPRSTAKTADEERGLVFLGICASIENQFEFVKREWLDDGHGLHQGLDPDPIAGSSTVGGKFVRQSERAPFVRKLDTFVTPGFGEYFFAPSMTMLHHLGENLGRR